MEPSRMEEALAAERLEAELVSGKGTVKSLRLDDGFGFIGPDEGDDDLIVRAESVSGGLATLAEGARVEFVVDEGAQGLEAYRVVLLDSPR